MKVFAVAILLCMVGCHALRTDPPGALVPTTGQTTGTAAEDPDCISRCPATAAVFVLDSSSSVSNAEMDLMTKGVKEFLGNLNAGKTNPADMSSGAIIQAFSAATDSNTYKANIDYIRTGEMRKGGANTDIISDGRFASEPSQLSLPTPDLSAPKSKEPYKPGTATDWFTGLSKAVDLVLTRPEHNKVVVVFFDGFNNVLSQGMDLTTVSSLFSQMKSAIQRGTADGASIWFMGIAIDEAHANTLKVVAKCQEAVNHPDDAAKVGNCLGKVAADAAASPDAQVRARAKNAVEYALQFNKATVQMYEYLSTKLAPTHQFKRTTNFGDLQEKVKEQAKIMCESMPATVHFDTSKPSSVEVQAPFKPCTNTFFRAQCATEAAVLIKTMKCCKETVNLGGHTSRTGTASSNVELSKRRVAVVAKILRDAGITNQIMGGAFGESAVEDEADTGANDNNRPAANNRRVSAYCGAPKSVFGAFTDPYAVA